MTLVTMIVLMRYFINENTTYVQFNLLITNCNGCKKNKDYTYLLSRTAKLEATS